MDDEVLASPIGPIVFVIELLSSDENKDIHDHLLEYFIYFSRSSVIKEGLRVASKCPQTARRMRVLVLKASSSKDGTSDASLTQFVPASKSGPAVPCLVRATVQQLYFCILLSGDMSWI